MTNDLFGGDLPEDGPDEDFEALRAALAETLADFADEQDIDESVLSVLLVDAAVAQRMLAYVLATEKPSEGGLKLDLDRFGRAINDLLRSAKKDARPTLERLTKVIAAILSAADDEEEEE